MSPYTPQHSTSTPRAQERTGSKSLCPTLQVVSIQTCLRLSI
ncbi:unnamed protein product [Brassica oleracea var. botrytis]|uniref:(rape) hypothetical protein n=1 Tax=Brassica napus TaxID=3708 RepID=A0A816JSN8_BRANA|nr:unnamed protein product [Brassica napus]CAF1859797.1 unnamed protein product [Brassica napus]